jgi:hypothetical protein
LTTDPIQDLQAADHLGVFISREGGRIMDSIWNVVVPAVIGLLSGAIGSLIAPWVNWGIEKHRARLKHRKEVVDRIRTLIDHPGFNKQSFRRTQEYLHLKPLIGVDVVNSVESDLHALVPANGDEPHAAYRRALHEALTELEYSWDLI